ncbi:MAG TPA: lysylphosphatidylglycerol synthase transmembrane domain-containing protein [Terriglobales bacterium]|nr:lysylphosphatidylglycerol synthase transmembrane domain-containing protein [Terriglobales bacterium]
MANIFKTRGLRIAAGCVLAAVCLAWVFRNTQWSDFAKSIAGFRWPLAAAAVVLQLLSFVGQGYRWRLLLAPLGPVRLLRTTQAVYCGLGMTFIVPFGFGEVTRGYFISDWMSKPFVSVLPSIALERLFDAVWLAVGIGVTAVAVKLPRNLDRAADIFGGVVIALVGLVLFLSTRKRRSGEAGSPPGVRRGKVRIKLSSLIERLGDGFRSIGFTRGLLGAFVISLLMYALQATSLWLLMMAYGLRLPFQAAVAVFFITLFGTAVPVAPAGIGTYQFFCVVALTLLGVGRTDAAGFSIVAYIFLNLPLLAVCLFALSKCGMTLASIKEKLRAQRGQNA